MKKRQGLSISISAILSLALTAGNANAGIYKDDLTRCVVAATNAEDRDDLLRWIFAAMATNPKIKDMSKISPEQSEAMSRTTAHLMQRLMLTDCRRQTVEAIRYEGGAAIQEAFSVLGQTAMADLMRGEATNAYMGSLSQHLDEEQWKALTKEAGIPTPPAKAK